MDGNVWTMSGGAAGLDGTLAWVEEVFGEREAKGVEMALEYERRLDAGWDPFSLVWNETMR